jgi:succinate dehydrogenase / fumarate reductase flavoprotein subunit
MIDVLHGPGTIAKELPAMVRQYRRFGIDLAKEPILVYPTLHYQNGGVAIRPDGSTRPGTLPERPPAGSTRNRLMGNSLLDICVFGRPEDGGGLAHGEIGERTLAHLRAWSQAADVSPDPALRHRSSCRTTRH